jgi:hypothetical protein
MTEAEYFLNFSREKYRCAFPEVVIAHKLQLSRLVPALCPIPCRPHLSQLRLVPDAHRFELIAQAFIARRRRNRIWRMGED